MFSQCCHEVYNAIVNSITLVLREHNYYPFGLLHRGYNEEKEDLKYDKEQDFIFTVQAQAGRYKYKFQGQERQEDLDLGWDSFKYRNYDYAIGRFFNVDPLAEKFPYNGVYNFSENRVVDGVELEGLEWERTIDKNGNVVSATYVGYDENGNAPEGTVPYVAWSSTLNGVRITSEGSESFTENVLMVGDPSGNIKVYNTNENGAVELPDPSEVGNTYQVYNRTGDDQWGSPQGIASIINAAVDYNLSTGGKTVSIGDIKAPDLKGVKLGKGKHHNGSSMMVDVRLIGANGNSERGNFSQINLSTSYSLKFIQSMNKFGYSEVVLDKAIISRLISNQGIKGRWIERKSGWNLFISNNNLRFKMDPNGGHKDHFHFQGYRN